MSFSGQLLLFPFALLAGGLRRLSLCGGIGNGVAMALWAITALLPLLTLRRHPMAGEASGAERACACACALVTAGGIYAVINPSLFCSELLTGDLPGAGGAEPMLDAVRMIANVTILSFWVLCLVLRFLRGIRGGDKSYLLSRLPHALAGVALLFLAVGIAGLVAGVQTFLAQPAGLDGVFALLSGASSLLLNVLYAYLCLTGIFVLLAACGEEQQSLSFLMGIKCPVLRDADMERAEQLRGRAGRLRQQSLRVLILSVLLPAGINLLQFLFMSRLTNVAVTASIPVVGIAFTLMTLLLSGLLVENKELRDDSELFI